MSWQRSAASAIRSAAGAAWAPLSKWGRNNSARQSRAPTPGAASEAAQTAPPQAGRSAGVNLKRDRQVEDVNFVFSEAVRLTKMDWREIPREDVLGPDLPHPSGSGGMIIGRAAGERIERLAREAGEQASLSRRVTAERMRRALGRELVRRFIKDGRPVEGREVDRALSSAAKAVRRDTQDIRHLIPCHLMRAKDPEEIIIGPVRFLNRKATRRRLLELLQIRRAKGSDSPDESKLDNEMLAEAVAYYRNFGWVAEVEIKGCDEQVSERLAERAVTSALDCLHLILGAQWTDRMQVGGPALRFDRRAAIRVNHTNEIYYSLSSSGFGQVNFSDGWSDRLSNSDHQLLFELFGAALEVAVDPDLDRPLSRRVLDAAQWFGEAARDPSESTRVVKYVTALERMLMTEERDDIASTISNRLAAFCAEDLKDFDTWVTRTRDVYDLRSRLVHGSISPGSQDVRRGVALSARVSEAGIINSLAAIGLPGLREARVSRTRLARWFASMVEGVREQIKTSV